MADLIIINIVLVHMLWQMRMRLRMFDLLSNQYPIKNPNSLIFKVER